MEKRLFTSECVTCGHPDKVADAISDAILDACLAQDPDSRVACETMVTTNFCLICGEITTRAQVDYPAVARQVIREIGYVYPECGFDADTVEIQCRVHTQSADIALGTNDQVGGAGDQGMMFGGADAPACRHGPGSCQPAHRLHPQQRPAPSRRQDPGDGGV